MLNAKWAWNRAPPLDMVLNFIQGCPRKSRKIWHTEVMQWQSVWIVKEAVWALAPSPLFHGVTVGGHFPSLVLCFAVFQVVLSCQSKGFQSVLPRVLGFQGNSPLGSVESGTENWLEEQVVQRKNPQPCPWERSLSITAPLFYSRGGEPGSVIHGEKCLL